MIILLIFNIIHDFHPVDQSLKSELLILRIDTRISWSYAHVSFPRKGVILSRRDSDGITENPFNQAAIKTAAILFHLFSPYDCAIVCDVLPRVAQLVERSSYTRLVPGSSPGVRTEGSKNRRTCAPVFAAFCPHLASFYSYSYRNASIGLFFDAWFAG